MEQPAWFIESLHNYFYAEGEVRRMKLKTEEEKVKAKKK